MTMRITMTQSRLGEAGSVLVAGTTYTVSDPFGAAMVGAGYATDTDGVLTPPVTALSPATVTALNSLVSGASIAIADRPVASENPGALLWVDLNNGLPAILMRSNGVNWCVPFPSLIARNNTIFSGVNALGEQYLSNLVCPGNLLFPAAKLEWRQGYAKSDGVDATLQTVQRIGPLGTISDQAPLILAHTAMGATTRGGGTHAFLRITPSNTIIREGNPGVVNMPFSSISTSSAFGTASFAQNLADPIYFGASVTLAAATGTTLPQITGQELWMLP